MAILLYNLAMLIAAVISVAVGVAETSLMSSLDDIQNMVDIFFFFFHFLFLRTGCVSSHIRINYRVRQEFALFCARKQREN